MLHVEGPEAEVGAPARGWYEVDAANGSSTVLGVCDKLDASPLVDEEKG